MRKRTIIAGVAIFGVATLTGMNFNNKETPLLNIPSGLRPIPTFYTPIKRDSFYEKEFIKSELKRTANYKVDNFDNDSREILLARLILGEADECSQLEKIAVAYTVINRVNASNGRKSIKEVILAPKQYSCFNKGTDSLKFLKDPMKYGKKEFLAIINLAEDILSKKYDDPTKGATHYYNPDLVKTPQWAKELKNLGKMGHHIFFK
jgi:N-acetylmuramoyl-L-alanine amidase